MSYYLSVLKNSPIGLWKMDEASGLVAYDSSGCGNNGSYVGQIVKSGMPIVSGGEHTNKIDSSNYVQFNLSKDFSGTNGTGGFATLDTSDNDFTLEAWIHPKTITSLTPILADSNGIGLYWDNGNIVFQLEDERIDYSVPDPDRAIHIAGVYSVNLMSLYLNGNLVANQLVDINFTNSSVLLSSGPANNDEYFLIDSPAVYRYALSNEAIMSHYVDFLLTNDEQVSVPDFGQLFVASEKYNRVDTKYSYPQQESWKSLVYNNSNLSYSEKNNSIYLNSGSSLGYFVEDLVLNITKDYISSKIDWSASSGVSIYVSETSESGPWVECVKGSSIPGFTQGSSFSETKILYFKIEFASEDSDVYKPELYSLDISFYLEKRMFSHNSGNTVETLQPLSGQSWDIDIPSKSYPVRGRNYNNGIKTKSSAFCINLVDEARSIEMIFTPSSLGAGHLLFNKTNSTETSISWSVAGVISKSNISGIYINGQDASAATNISSYLYLNEPNYILIKAASQLQGEIWLNGKQIDGARSGVLEDNIYQNIATYSDSSINHIDHYRLYVGQPAATGEGSSISVTEESVATYSRDRLVFQIL